MQLGLAFDVALEKVDAFVVIDGYFDDDDAAVDALCLQRPLTVRQRDASCETTDFAVGAVSFGRVRCGG